MQDAHVPGKRFYSLPDISNEHVLASSSLNARELRSRENLCCDCAWCHCGSPCVFRSQPGQLQALPSGCQVLEAARMCQQQQMLPANPKLLLHLHMHCDV